MSSLACKKIYSTAGASVCECRVASTTLQQKNDKKIYPRFKFICKILTSCLISYKKNNNVDDFDIECNILGTAIFYLAFIVITKMKKVGTLGQWK